MDQIYIARFGVFVIIVSIVLGIYWPHLKSKYLLRTLERLVDPYELIFEGNRHTDHEELDLSRSKADAANNHPIITGQVFSKKESSTTKQPHRSWYNLFGDNGGKGGSDGSQPIRDPSALFWSSNANAIPGKPINIPSQNDPSTSILFILIATIMVLTIYVLVSKSRRLFGTAHRADSLGGRGPASGRFPNHIADTRSRRGIYDKRPSLNRSGKTSRLLMHHSGSNLSSSIKFLVDELEKQKLILIESLSSSHIESPVGCPATQVDEIKLDGTEAFSGPTASD